MAPIKKTTTWIAAATLGVLVALAALMASLLGGMAEPDEESGPAIVIKDEEARQKAIIVDNAPASSSPSPSPSPSPSASPSPTPSPAPTQGPEASTAGATSRDAEANIWGVAPGANPQLVWVEVQIDDGTWSRSQETNTADDGTYVLPLTYGKGSTGTFNYRVGINAGGGNVLYSDVVTLARKAPPAPAKKATTSNSGSSGGSTSAKNTTSAPKTAAKEAPKAAPKPAAKPAAKPAPKPAPKYYDDDDDDDDDDRDDDDDDRDDDDDDDD